MAWREEERFSAYINSEPEKKAYYENELQTTILFKIDINIHWYVLLTESCE